MNSLLLKASGPFFICALLCGCGPREIGEGSSEYAGASSGNLSAADGMRYPMMGSGNTQQMLYYYNKPEVMENTQSVIRGNYLRRMGIQPTPEDPAYRAQPKQRSPFRQ